MPFANDAQFEDDFRRVGRMRLPRSNPQAQTAIQPSGQEAKT